MHQRILEGTWAEVAKEAASLEAGTHVRLEIVETKPGAMIRKGMFPQLRGISDEDLSSAQWHGPRDEDC